MHNNQIQYLTHQQVDKDKWDAAIAAAPNGVVYANSFYLDAMAKHWDALVMGNYEAVMPITWNSKYGVHYLYQPFLCASLGVFGRAVTAEMIQNFLSGILPKFRYWDFSLNHGNLYNINGFNLYERKNFILNLGKPYEVLYNQFNENTKRNIKKAQHAGCLITKPSFSAVLQLAKDQLKSLSPIADDDFERFSKLYHYMEQRDAAFTYGATAADGRLLSSCVFFLWQHRAYYILVGNHPESKRTGASHALINGFIEDHAGKNFVLDFEGSDIPGLAAFYSSFGATEENYPAIRLNRLPGLLKWMKK